MMNSIYFGLCLIAIILIVHWYVINDGKGQNDGTRGFLAMRPTRSIAKSAKPERQGKRSFRRHS